MAMHVTGQQALVYAERMATTSTSLWAVAGPAKDRFQYELGVFLRGIELVFEATNAQTYLQFLKFKVDRLVNEDGTITTYVANEFQLDSVLTGRLLLTLFKATGESKYRAAAGLLREQLRTQPRLNEGAFWHKAVYPYQMWLDGLYMAEPFYAQYASEFNEPAHYDDIALQFIVGENRTRDPTTGLLCHGYDESRVSSWSDPVTGHSPSVWGRAVGWYAMGIVDTLDFFPAAHPKRPALVAILNRLAVSVKRVQDARSGLWWQVMDRGGDAGNYLESSASAMFVYTLAKGVRLGYLSRDQFLECALTGYDGLVSHFVQDSGSDGGVTYTGTVAVGGLGGDPYRSGSYAYYLSEPVVSNDPKGVGPFMMASVEILRATSSDS
jgi:unsaturated rhamnogalacturonyl hydrolase